MYNTDICQNMYKILALPIIDVSYFIYKLDQSQDIVTGNAHVSS